MVGTRRTVEPGSRGWGLGVGLEICTGKYYCYNTMEVVKTHTWLGDSKK
jgi:hypothetical protein